MSPNVGVYVCVHTFVSEWISESLPPQRCDAVSVSNHQPEAFQAQHWHTDREQGSSPSGLFTIQGWRHCALFYELPSLFLRHCHMILKKALSGWITIIFRLFGLHCECKNIHGVRRSSNLVHCLHLTLMPACTQYVHITHVYWWSELWGINLRGREPVLWTGNRAIYKQINYADAYGNQCGCGLM